MQSGREIKKKKRIRQTNEMQGGREEKLKKKKKKVHKLVIMK